MNPDHRARLDAVLARSPGRVCATRHVAAEARVPFPVAAAYLDSHPDVRAVISMTHGTGRVSRWWKLPGRDPSEPKLQKLSRRLRLAETLLRGARDVLRAWEAP